ncbi:MAG: hemerythrin family protein [Desulfovibrionaceae bacterium]|nr:hemerythrin family protein [Desulfovibrionaceae bacterium]
MMEWNDRLSVNIRDIDSQHKQLVAMLNRLHDAMKAGSTGAVIAQIVSEMKRYSVSHFTTEEGYMKKHGYPDYTAHKAEHEKFVAKVAQVERDLQAGAGAMSMDILNFLSNWMITHIRGTDKKYTPFLNAAGVQ